MFAPPPTLEHICDFEVALSPVTEMGQHETGQRRIVPITGGTVTGPRLSGKILNVGADWQTVYTNGVAHLDARYALETPDGAIIEVTSQGFRHGPPEVMKRVAAGEDVGFDEYYMRTAITLQTGHPDYDWLNRSIFVSTGGRKARAVHLSIYRVG